MHVQGDFVEVNGARMYYEIAGSGHPLALIHGFSLDSRMWDDQFGVFSNHYQVIRYDVRGFGKSALPTDISYAHTDDLKALLAYLGVERTSVLGLSMGGEIAINFALTYPETVDALVLADSALQGFQWREFGLSIASVAARGRESGIQAAKELWLSLDLFKPAMEQPDVAARLTQMVSDYSGWHAVNRDPARAPEPPAIQQLETIDVPTLIIIGERDLSDFHAVTNVLHQGISGSKKAIIPAVGHLSNMEAPHEFAKLVLGFLASI